LIEKSMCFSGHFFVPQKSLAEFVIRQCPTTVLRLGAGRKVSAEARTTAPITSSVEVVPEAGKLPLPMGAAFLSSH
jgi:hypothetical protein